MPNLFLFFFLFNFTCMSVWLNLSLCTSCVPGAQRPKDGVRSSETGVIFSYKLPCGCCELNLGPTEEQPECSPLVLDIRTLLQNRTTQWHALTSVTSLLLQELTTSDPVDDSAHFISILCLQSTALPVSECVPITSGISLYLWLS